MANKIAIYTDSGSDITPREREELNVTLIPMSLVFDTDSFLDDHTVQMSRIWERMESGEILTTSQPSLQNFLDAFQQARDQGVSVVYISISSAVSGTCQTARAAANMVGGEDIYIVDAQQAAATVAEKVLVCRACRLRDEGKLSAGEIAQDLERFRSRVRLFACIDSLEYLVRGGRLSKLAGNVGTLLNIKPIITFSPQGGVQVIKKAPGLKRAFSELCALVEAHPVDVSYPIIPLYAKDSANCRDFVCQLKGTTGLTVDKPMQEIGATIGCHIGPGGFGVVYVEAEK